MTPDWLGERLAESPPDLRAPLERVVADLESDGSGRDLAGALTGEAVRRLDAIHHRLNDRAAAFELLLADGLLTLACEAAARHEPGSLVERCHEMGPDGRLGELARRWAGEV